MFDSAHGGETMEKEPYVTPEITTEDVAPGALAQVGSPGTVCGCGCS